MFQRRPFPPPPLAQDPANKRQIFPKQGPGLSEAGATVLSPSVDKIPVSTFRLRILATTDIHAQLMSYDYYANRPQFGLGLAQTASLIRQARDECPDSILLDNGDFLQGSILAELAAANRRRHRAHPAIAAFNALGYDAVTLGNHEFNYGLRVLEDALAGARFPVVSANVLRQMAPDALHDQMLVAPYTLIRRSLTGNHGENREICIGVFGLAPPELLDWDRSVLDGHITVRPMLDAARAWVPEIRRAGADVVVCLAHTGIGLEPLYGRNEGLAADIAAIPGIDAVVAGHSHQVFPGADVAARDPRIDAATGCILGTPTVQPGHSGSHLGIIDLTLRPLSGGWEITGTRARAISASEVVAGMSPEEIRRGAAPLRGAIEADHRATLSFTRNELGRTRTALTTYFALAGDVRAMRALAAAKTAYAAAALAGQPAGSLPILASVTPYRMGGNGGPLNYTDIPPGPLTMRHVFDLYPFPNGIAAAEVTGAELRARLERAAAIYNRINAEGRDQPLIDPRFPAYTFEQIPRLSYQIDLSRPALPAGGAPGEGRIRDLHLDDQPVRDDDRFVLVTNSFRFGTDPDLRRKLFLHPQKLCSAVIADHLRAGGEFAALPGSGWSFVPMPGTSVLFDSGTGAAANREDVARLDPDLVGITDQGFHRFRLHL